MAPPSPSLQKKVNRWLSKIAPTFMILVAGYVTYTTIALIAVNYLINPPPSKPTRHGAGITVIIVYFLTFLPMATSYFRVVGLIISNPGFVPKPYSDSSASNKAYTADKGHLDRASVLNGQDPPPLGLEQFYKRDVFECDVDGLPRWCSTCLNWKPDRSHHCSEVGRCVYKMDHFCPWTGGMISDTNYKFFLIYLVYATLYAAFVLINSAYFTAETIRKGYGYNPQWIATIAFGAFFFLFGIGMGLSSFPLAAINTTTVDSIARRSRTIHLAVLMPRPPTPEDENKFRTITFPLPSEGSAATKKHPPRTFAILSSPQGRNPYQLATPFQDLKTVMGNRWYEWILPIKPSPCFQHRVKMQEAEESVITGGTLYDTGPLLNRMMEDAGLVEPSESDRDPNTRKKKNKGRNRRHSLTERGG